MTKKNKSRAKGASAADWKLIFNKNASVTSDPDEPEFTVGQNVTLTFVNKSGGPVIMGFVTIGRNHKDPSDPTNDDLVDNKPNFYWVPYGEIDSGDALIDDGDSSDLISFTVSKIRPAPGARKWRFHYCCFTVGPTQPIRTGKKTKPKSRLWRVLGWGVDPHVIITS